MDQIFELQNEIGHMKALKDIPFELIKILRKQSSKARSSLADCEDDGRTLMNSNSNSRKSMHRSKSRKANKVASGNDERKEKGSKHLGLEINIVIWEIALAKRARNLIVSTSSINHTFEQYHQNSIIKGLSRGSKVRL